MSWPDRQPSRHPSRQAPVEVAPVEAAPSRPSSAAPQTDQVAAAAAAQTAELLHRFRPGQNLDAEIEAYEREQAALEASAAACHRHGRRR